jgi:hypothetical protein
VLAVALKDPDGKQGVLFVEPQEDVVLAQSLRPAVTALNHRGFEFPPKVGYLSLTFEYDICLGPGLALGVNELNARASISRLTSAAAALFVPPSSQKYLST